jgi:hypothetical protein
MFFQRFWYSFKVDNFSTINESIFKKTNDIRVKIRQKIDKIKERLDQIYEEFSSELNHRKKRLEK